MLIEELEQDLGKGNLKSIYVLHGEEKFLLDTIVKKIKKNFGECINGINYISIDETNIANLISDIDRKSTRLNSSHRLESRMPSSA